MKKTLLLKSRIINLKELLQIVLYKHNFNKMEGDIIFVNILLLFLLRILESDTTSFSRVHAEQYPSIFVSILISRFFLCEKF